MATEEEKKVESNTVIDLEKMSIKFIDTKTGDKIELAHVLHYQSKKPTFNKKVNDKAAECYANRLHFYKGTCEIIDENNKETHNFPKQDSVEIVKTLQHFCPKIELLEFYVNGVKCFKRCIEDHAELKYKTYKQLIANDSKLLRIYYKCSECNKQCTSYSGSCVCQGCDYKLCIPCYFGKDNVQVKCGQEKHELQCVENEEPRSCDLCSQAMKHHSPQWVCKLCNCWDVCIKCYTKGKILMCTDLHPLSYFTKNELVEYDEYKCGSFICVQCTQKINLTYGVYHCAICNYDVCSGCYLKQTKTKNEEKKTEIDEEDIMNDSKKCYGCCREVVDVEEKEDQNQSEYYYCNTCGGIREEFMNAKDEWELWDVYRKYGQAKEIQFKPEYKDYMPLAQFYMIYIKNTRQLRMEWNFDNKTYDKLEHQICYVAVIIKHIGVDEDYEKEVAICNIKMSLKYYWLFDTNDADHHVLKKLNLAPKKWTKFETNRPWEPQVECVAPAVAKTDQNAEDVEFEIIPVSTFFGDNVMDGNECNKPMGFMRTTQHEVTVQVEEPLELESYPFDEQDVPIIFGADNFCKFVPALNFSNNDSMHKTSVVTVVGDAVDAGNWKVAAVLAEFGTINNSKGEIPNLEKNQFSIRIKFRRHWKWVLIQYAFLIFCVTCLSLTTFIFEIDENVSKLEFVSGLILTLVFIELPSMPVFSILHKYFYVSFAFLVLIAVQSAISNALEEWIDIFLVIFAGGFIIYHIAFIIISIHASWKEHQKVTMSTKEIQKEVEERKAFLTLNSTLKTENVLFEGSSGLFTELPSFSNLKMKKKKTLKKKIYDSTNKQLAQELIQYDIISHKDVVEVEDEKEHSITHSAKKKTHEGVKKKKKKKKKKKHN
eukprot:534761_1